MWFEQVLFFVAGLGAIAGALGVVILRNPFYSVLALVGHLIALALLFLLLHAEFLAAGQVVVYAGAVMVLYIFVVAYIGGSDEPLRPEGGLISAFGPLFAVAIGIELCIAFVASGLKALDTQGADLPGAPSCWPAAGAGSRTWPRWLHAAKDLSLTSPAAPRTRRPWRCGSKPWTSPGSSSSRPSSSPSEPPEC